MLSPRHAMFLFLAVALCLTASAVDICQAEMQFRSKLTSSTAYFERASGANKPVALYGLSMSELAQLRRTGSVPFRTRHELRPLSASGPERLIDRNYYGPLRKFGSGQSVFLRKISKNKWATDSTIAYSTVVTDPIEQRNPYHALKDSAVLQGSDLPESILRNITAETAASVAILSLRASAFEEPFFLKSLDVWRSGEGLVGFCLVVSLPRALNWKDIGRVFATEQALIETAP